MRLPVSRALVRGMLAAADAARAELPSLLLFLVKMIWRPLRYSVAVMEGIATVCHSLSWLDLLRALARVDLQGVCKTCGGAGLYICL